MTVNIAQTQTDFSELLNLLESKQEERIILARNGQDIAQITLLAPSPVSRRIGIAKGKCTIPDDFDRYDDEIDESLRTAAIV